MSERRKESKEREERERKERQQAIEKKAQRVSQHISSLKKTPSKMDVAPWDKHWIKREFDGFGLYSMVFVEIQWYSMVFVEIQWYS